VKYVEPLNEKITEMVEYSVGYASGVYNFPYPEHFEELTQEERENFWSVVYQEADTCNACGWRFNLNEMDYDSYGVNYCSRCFDNMQEEEE